MTIGKFQIGLAAIALMAVTAVVLGQLRNIAAPVSAAAILYLVADTERELSRLPVSVINISDSDESALGDQLARQYLQRFDVRRAPDDQAIADYVDRIGATVSAHAHRKLPYRFHYVPDEFFVNAFALPGGHVFIGKGLLALMDREDELADVLGHEVEHIDLRHCAERAQVDARLRKLPAGELASIPVELFQAGYSKEQEFQADREGVKLGVLAGYSAQGAVRIFAKFEKLDAERRPNGSERRKPDVVELPLDLANVLVVGTLEEYFRSHPPPAERIAKIQALIAAERWHAEEPQKPLAVAYILRSAEAARLLSRDQLERASLMAHEALDMKPGYVPALNILGEASFRSADFPLACQNFRRSLTLEPRQTGIPALYATSLLSSLPARDALEQYQALLQSLSAGARASGWLQVEQAGMTLAAGGSDAAIAFRQSVGNGETPDAPLLEARLGWWYYIAGQPDTASALINSAAEQRPQVASIGTELAWVLIAQRKYESALQRLNPASVNENRDEQADAQMALAVAEWQGKQADLALISFRTAARNRRVWRDRRWITAVYGPTVAQAVEDMRIEDARRHKGNL